MLDRVGRFDRRCGRSMPVEAEDIPTWKVQGRVQRAGRRVPGRWMPGRSKFWALTREDAGSDGWLRLFSGRFVSESDAIEHRDELRAKGRADAFVVVYINGRRTPLSQARTTAVAGIAGVGQPEESRPRPAQPAEPEAVPFESGWRVELGRFSSTIPVRLANAILDAPLDWEIRSERRGTNHHDLLTPIRKAENGWRNPDGRFSRHARAANDSNCR